MPILKQDQQKLPQPRLLFVDDEVPILNLFKFFFSDLAEVSIACDGMEALKQITDKSFDCIVCDVDMPILNGFDLFKSLYAKDPSISKRFLFCTGHPSSEFVDFCSSYQIKYLCKPVSLLNMQEKLRPFYKGNKAGDTCNDTV